MLPSIFGCKSTGDDDDDDDDDDDKALNTSFEISACESMVVSVAALQLLVTSVTFSKL
jgi:hypothetical protein